MAERKRSAKDTFTAGEVGALLEEIRSEFRTVVDIAREVKTDLEGLKRWGADVDEKLVKLDFILTELQGLRADLKTVEAKVGL